MILDSFIYIYFIVFYKHAQTHTVYVDILVFTSEKYI